MSDAPEGRFVVYDTESSGVDLDYDQVYQFAAVEADADLNIIPGSEVNLLCRPRRDVVPSPEAFLVHHLNIEILRQDGMSEYELARHIQRLFLAQPVTGILGYNNMSYDDEMVRRMLFRNGFNPYEHEFRGENFRGDIYNLIRLVYAYRPELLEFPVSENDGKVSLRLEALSKANGLNHENAHEALSDVIATTELARLIKTRCGGIWEWFLKMTDKTFTRSLLTGQEPLLYTGGRVPREFRHTSLVLPVIGEEENKNGILAVDLRHDPSDMLAMSVDELRHYLFSKRETLEEGAPRIPALRIACNKQPLLVKTEDKLNDAFADSIALDIGACERHRAMVQADPGFRARLQAAFSSSQLAKPDVGASIYTGGFLSRTDANTQKAWHLKEGESKGGVSLPRLATQSAVANAGGMADNLRQYQLATRARWNNFAGLIERAGASPNELAYYHDYLKKRLFHPEALGNGLSLDQARQRIRELRMARPLDDEELFILEQLEAHMDVMERMPNLFLVDDKAIQAERTEKPRVRQIMERLEKDGVVTAARPVPTLEPESP